MQTMQPPPVQVAQAPSDGPPAALPPGIVALGVQAASALLAIAVCAAWPDVVSWPWIAAPVAAAASAVLRMDWWWIPINGLIVPGALLAQGSGISPDWFLAAFVLTALTFCSVARDRVPLFLSSSRACRALTTLLPKDRPFRLADLGCGSGSVLAHVASARPDGAIVGVERAPLPCAVAWLRTRVARNRCRVMSGSLWSLSLDGFDVVYAYLSPVPMPRLWRKARAEMRPGSFFVSNSFGVPGVPPDFVIELDDAVGARLLVWRM